MLYSPKCDGETIAAEKTEAALRMLISITSDLFDIDLAMQKIGRPFDQNTQNKLRKASQKVEAVAIQSIHL